MEKIVDLNHKDTTSEDILKTFSSQLRGDTYDEIVREAKEVISKEYIRQYKAAYKTVYGKEPELDEL
jgi:hypothetical protein